MFTFTHISMNVFPFCVYIRATSCKWFLFSYILFHITFPWINIVWSEPMATISIGEMIISCYNDLWKADPPSSRFISESQKKIIFYCHCVWVELQFRTGFYTCRTIQLKALTLYRLEVLNNLNHQILLLMYSPLGQFPAAMGWKTKARRFTIEPERIHENNSFKSLAFPINPCSIVTCCIKYKHKHV